MDYKNVAVIVGTMVLIYLFRDKIKEIVLLIVEAVSISKKEPSKLALTIILARNQEAQLLPLG